MDAIAAQPRPLGHQGQEPLRRLERQARTRALMLCRWAALHDLSVRHVARRIGLAPQTLGEWARARQQQRQRRGGSGGSNSGGDDARGRTRSVPAAAPRGRPRYVLSQYTGEHVWELLEECRGRLGLCALKSRFPDVPRSDLAALRGRYLAQHAAGDRALRSLAWTTPGSVWAADFTQADLPVDGVYRFILSIRDLAAGFQILSLPVTRADADATAVGLTHLFAAHGPPLVLKTDNGSHFAAHDITRVLGGSGVLHLESPPKTPRYNGSIEAGIGSVKARALLIAGTQGRGGCWTCDDFEAARLEANDQARPWGLDGPSPDQRWQTRAPIAPPQRDAFIRAVADATHEEARTMILKTPALPAPTSPAGSLNASERAVVARRAIRRVLLDLGYLSFRRTATSSTPLDYPPTGDFKRYTPSGAGNDRRRSAASHKDPT